MSKATEEVIVLADPDNKPKLANQLEQLADRRWAEIWLCLGAFFNSFLIPLPTELLLLPLCIARPRRSWWYASLATVASVLGGLAGYAIGAFAFATIGSSIVALYGTPEEFTALTTQFNNIGMEWILLATVSPLPYKLVTVTSGVSGMNVGLFIVASVMGRFIGYFLLAAACWKFGERAKSLMTSSAVQFASIGILLIAGSYLIFGST